MGLRKDRRGMAVLLDAFLFLLAMSLLTVMVLDVPTSGVEDDRGEVLRSYHSVMLAGEMPIEGGSALSALSLAEYLVALSMSEGPLADGPIALINRAVAGTLLELTAIDERAWWELEVDGRTYVFGADVQGEVGDVHADRRELGDGKVICTLLLGG